MQSVCGCVTIFPNLFENNLFWKKKKLTLEDSKIVWGTTVVQKYKVKWSFEVQNDVTKLLFWLLSNSNYAGQCYLLTDNWFPLMERRYAQLCSKHEIINEGWEATEGSIPLKKSDSFCPIYSFEQITRPLAITTSRRIVRNCSGRQATD